MSNKTSDENVANVEELIQEYKTYNDLDEIQDLSIYVNALEHILAEREQKDKRIQELEEKLLDMIQGTEIINKETPEYVKENYIPKQAVTDLIENETINISGFECIAVEDLQELLEGERK